VNPWAEGLSFSIIGGDRDVSAVMVTVGVRTGVGVTVAEMMVVVVMPPVVVITTVMFTLSGVGVKVGMGRCVGVGGSVAVGVAVLPGGAIMVGRAEGLAVNVGGVSTATSGSRLERRRNPPIPRQYRSSVTVVMTVSRL